MKVRSSAIELTNELEKDLALVMLIEKRGAGRIGPIQARDLIEKIKGALRKPLVTASDPLAQELSEGFPFH